MTVLSHWTLRQLKPLDPFIEATKIEGLSAGLSHCGYDIRIKQDVVLPPGGFALASSVERFVMPLNVCGMVMDKSTLARMGLTVQTTIAEPGWEGWLTLELSNNHPPFISTLSIEDLFFRMTEDSLSRGILEIDKNEYDRKHTITLRAGQPIAQVVFHKLDNHVSGYDGKYQNQADEPVPAILETDR